MFGVITWPYQLLNFGSKITAQNEKLISNLCWGAEILPLSWKFVRCKQLQAFCGHRTPGGPGFTGWPWTWIPATLHSFLKLKDNNKRKWTTTTSQCTALFLLDDPVSTFYMPATLHSTLSLELKADSSQNRGRGLWSNIFIKLQDNRLLLMYRTAN